MYYRQYVNKKSAADIKCKPQNQNASRYVALQSLRCVCSNFLNTSEEPKTGTASKTVTDSKTVMQFAHATIWKRWGKAAGTRVTDLVEAMLEEDRSSPAVFPQGLSINSSTLYVFIDQWQDDTVVALDEDRIVWQRIRALDILERCKERLDRYDLFRLCAKLCPKYHGNVFERKIGGDSSLGARTSVGLFTGGVVVCSPCPGCSAGCGFFCTGAQECPFVHRSGFCRYVQVHRSGFFRHVQVHLLSQRQTSCICTSRFYISFLRRV